MSEPWELVVRDLLVICDTRRILGESPFADKIELLIKELILAKAEIKRLEGLREDKDLHGELDFIGMDNPYFD